MKKTRTYIMRYWYMYLLGFTAMVISVSFDMISPRMQKIFVDDILAAGKTELLQKVVLMVALITIVRAITGYCKELCFDYAGVNVSYNIRKDLFNHIQGLSYRFFDRSNTGELMARIKDDAEKVWYSASFGVMLSIEVVFHSTFVVIMLFSVNPLLTVIALIAMPMIGVIALKLEKEIGKTYEDISEQNAKMNIVAQENLSGVRLVKAFAREKYEIMKFFKRNEKYYELNMKQSMTLAKYNPAIQYITKVLPFVVLLFGGIMVINSTMTIGELVAFMGYITMIVWPMEMIGWLASAMTEGIASNKKIRKIASEHSEIVDTATPVDGTNIKGSIEFRKVGLSLNDTKVIDNVSFKVDSGKIIGIMGNTGSGKSSLVNLLVRFYDATEGEILLDNINIKDYSLFDLRANIALVMQDVFLFSDSIAENITLGSADDITGEEIARAIELAQAKDFIERMDKKYDTIIGERGIGLSGGQKQRISIARAIAKKAPIIVFDDSTSALDIETEQNIQNNIKKLTGITQIIVAHRISSVRYADEIILLEDGRVIERGNHEELIKLKGKYYETFMEQYNGFDFDVATI